MLLAPLSKKSAFVRYICDQCMWSMDVLLLSEENPKLDFEMHDCEDYRRRSSLT